MRIKQKLWGMRDTSPSKLIEKHSYVSIRTPEYGAIKLFLRHLACNFRAGFYDLLVTGVKFHTHAFSQPYIARIIKFQASYFAEFFYSLHIDFMNSLHHFLTIFDSLKLTRFRKLIESFIFTQNMTKLILPQAGCIPLTIRDKQFLSSSTTIIRQTYRKSLPMSNKY